MQGPGLATPKGALPHGTPGGLHTGSQSMPAALPTSCAKSCTRLSPQQYCPAAPASAHTGTPGRFSCRPHENLAVARCMDARAHSVCGPSFARPATSQPQLKLQKNTLVGLLLVHTAETLCRPPASPS
uniref:Uncharacterized protein n=1 Tax=Chlamydomonas euryale TaxID=1486919 RepID=A0A7R9VQY0_9CHLO